MTLKYTGYHVPLGNVSWGFWLFIAAPVSKFDDFTSLTPIMCIQQGDRKVFPLGNLCISILNMVYIYIFKMFTVRIYIYYLLAMIL